jgi:hypothetical protein
MGALEQLRREVKTLTVLIREFVRRIGKAQAPGPQRLQHKDGRQTPGIRREHDQEDGTLG